MERNRRLTNDIYISRLGIGTWAIGGSGCYGDVHAAQAIDALDCYFSAGGNFIDTAEGYADGELVIGQFLKSTLKHEAVIATKTQAGRDRESIPNIEASLDKSLTRLGRDYVDLYYFHTPPSEPDVMEEALDVMQSLKKKGKIRAVGGSIKGVNVTDDTVKLCKQYIDSGKMDAIQLVYNILRQQTNEVFDYAIQHKIALVGRTSLETGFLSGKYKKGHRFAENDHRNRWNATYDMIAEHVDEIEKRFITQKCVDNDMTSLALRFAMYPEAMTNTIVGARTRAQVEELLTIIEKPPLNSETITTLEEMFRGKTHLFNTSNGKEW
ncbi:MAG: aldo/keto reductase [Faecalibacterium sp.]